MEPIHIIGAGLAGDMTGLSDEEKELLSHRCGEFLWLTVGGEDKMLEILCTSRQE